MDGVSYLYKKKNKNTTTNLYHKNKPKTGEMLFICFFFNFIIFDLYIIPLQMYLSISTNSNFCKYYHLYTYAYQTIYIAYNYELSILVVRLVVII